MKPRRICAVVALIMLTLAPIPVGAWGWGAHKKINEAAVKLLPADMQTAVEHEAASIAAHAPDPDHWKDDPLEHNRHWIDLELGDATGLPFEGLPRYKAEALRKFGADSLGKIGVLPWRIEEYFDKLVTSMAAPSGSTWVQESIIGFGLSWVKSG